MKPHRYFYWNDKYNNTFLDDTFSFVTIFIGWPRWLHQWFFCIYYVSHTWYIHILHVYFFVRHKIQNILGTRPYKHCIKPYRVFWSQKMHSSITILTRFYCQDIVDTFYWLFYWKIKDIKQFFRSNQRGTLR